MVISVRNYEGFCGFRLNSADYSAHPEENEYIFMEGLQLVVLKIEKVKVNSQLINPST